MMDPRCIWICLWSGLLCWLGWCLQGGYSHQNRVLLAGVIIGRTWLLILISGVQSRCTWWVQIERNVCRGLQWLVRVLDTCTIYSRTTRQHGFSWLSLSNHAQALCIRVWVLSDDQGSDREQADTRGATSDLLDHKLRANCLLKIILSGSMSVV